MFTRWNRFLRTFASEMKITERQKQARMLVMDYLGFLTDQEALVRRVVDERLAEMQPVIDAMVDERIRERLEQKK